MLDKAKAKRSEEWRKKRRECGDKSGYFKSNRGKELMFGRCSART